MDQERATPVEERPTEKTPTEKTPTEKTPAQVAEVTTASTRTRPVQREEVLGPLNALADQTRLQILELLTLHQSMLAQEIIAQLDVGQSTVSRHLQQLVAAGFVTEARAGDANKLYALQPARFEELFALLRQLLSSRNVAAKLDEKRRDLPQTLQRVVDQDGLLVIWPRRAKAREAVLDYLVNKFQRNQFYAEAEVNEMLNRWHTFADPANLRRQLVDYGYLGRTESGHRYWRER